jgi:hypothetical protein
MINKQLLRPQRLRHIPPSFSWVDHRLVRHEHLARADHSAWTLYLFLVTVADAQGLSFYSDAAVCRRLTMDPVTLSAARRQLVQVDLIAYTKPLYQVLSLPDNLTCPSEPAALRTGEPQSVASILRRALEGGGQ